ncbi:T-box transcription factor TBX20 [Bagarius yarrelli]|uniref:T-box transcription factor TBX20 n=1 Tax=Bagarius yarrelli TaxID=175774 RepID=A0A556VUQ5_BAGYA|nr:T-box transcription factor TBX20 [Bagarius yarrelli]
MTSQAALHTMKNFQSGYGKMERDMSRFPFCIVWTPIPGLTMLQCFERKQAVFQGGAGLEPCVMERHVTVPKRTIFVPNNSRVEEETRVNHSKPPTRPLQEMVQELVSFGGDMMEFSPCPKPQLSSRANAFSIAALISTSTAKEKESEENTIKPLEQFCGEVLGVVDRARCGGGAGACGAGGGVEVDAEVEGEH